MKIPENKKIYFASDQHFGVPNYKKSLEREKYFITWLDKVSKDAFEIYLLGDLFDFWFEYKKVVPKGYVRVLGKIAELVDIGISIKFFTGNHDMWVKDYFTKELGVTVYKKPIKINRNGKLFFIGHGDGLGPGDKGYKILKKIFQNSLSQWIFSIIPSRIGISIANYFSLKSRLANVSGYKTFLGKENEWLYIFSKEMLKKQHFDFFIFGHRHLSIDEILSNNSRYINLGDWINDFTYAVFNGNDVQLLEYKK